MPPFSCKICFEDLPPEDKCVLTKCSHECCKSCLQMLARSCGRLQQPLCPFCRTKVDKKDIRSSQQQQQQQQQQQPRRRGGRRGEVQEEQDGVEEGAEDEEVDEYTRHWLQENTTRCPRCELHVEQTEGADTTIVDCICGCSFCFTCGAEGSNCRCGSTARSRRNLFPTTGVAAARGGPNGRRRGTAVRISGALAGMRNQRTTPASRTAFLQRLFDRPTPTTLPPLSGTTPARRSPINNNNNNNNSNSNNHPSTLPLEELDEDTRQWLQENTRNCPSCGSPIERMDDCNEMSCLCGCSFCFACGSTECNCTNSNSNTTTDDFDFDEALWWQQISLELDDDSEDEGFDALWNRLDDLDMIGLASFIPFDDQEDGNEHNDQQEAEGDYLEELLLEHTNNTLRLEQAQNTIAMANIAHMYQFNDARQQQQQQQQQQQTVVDAGEQPVARRPARRRQPRRGTGRGMVRGETATFGRSRMQRQRQRGSTTRNGRGVHNRSGTTAAAAVAAAAAAAAPNQPVSRNRPPRRRRVRQVQQIERRTSAAAATTSGLAGWLEATTPNTEADDTTESPI